MSKLEELINKLCPNGVEFKKTKDLKRDSFWLMPATPNYIDKGVPYITSKNIRNGKIDFENVNYISQEDFIKISANRKIEKNDLLVTMIGTIGETAFVGDYCDFYGQNMYLIRLDENKINAKFFNYYLTSAQIKNSLISRKNTSSQGYIKAGSLEELSVPVPPLEVQCEIVRILDNFTLLSAELSAELSARQRQYDYYKQKVLDNIKTNNIKHITDIALVKARVGWQRLTRAEYLYEGNYFLITGTDFVADGSINFDTCVYISKDRYDMDQNIQVHKDDILITKDGTLGKVAILKDEPPKETTLNSGVFRISVLNKQEVYPQYLYHYFTSKYFKDFVESVKTGSTIPHLTQQGLVTLDIPIPELNEQVKISNLLDKFDKLCNDISEGLPAEIEARKKQYEYYRDKLLTFKELK